MAMKLDPLNRLIHSLLQRPLALLPTSLHMQDMDYKQYLVI